MLLATVLLASPHIHAVTDAEQTKEILDVTQKALKKASDAQAQLTQKSSDLGNKIEEASKQIEKSQEQIQAIQKKLEEDIKNGQASVEKILKGLDDIEKRTIQIQQAEEILQKANNAQQNIVQANDQLMENVIGIASLNNGTVQEVREIAQKEVASAIDNGVLKEQVETQVEQLFKDYALQNNPAVQNYVNTMKNLNN